MTATRFGAYEILQELRTGGMGSVLLGRRRGPGTFEQLVAIKTMRPELATTPAVRAMFLDEAAILARIAHPGIATVHDFGEDAGTLYMVMEYVAGTSFRALVDQILPPGVAARAIAEACRGLHAAHEARDPSGALLGLVHRDISPDNLMLGYDGHVKVIDFGIALVKNRQAPVTEFGTVKGKPPYMSPEQVKNEAMDRRSDVFSLAVVLHELLTGQPLFDGDSIYAIARAVEHQEIKPPSVVRGAPLAPGLDAAVMRALERDPSRRTPTAAQLAEELEQAIQAAGDETLEAWAERALAPPREAHRAWLTSVVSGGTAHKPMGRATGSITQPAALNGPLNGDAFPIVPSGQPDPAPSPSSGGGDAFPFVPSGHGSGAELDASLDRPPRRSILLPLLAALVVLGGLIAGVAVFGRAGTSTPPDAAIVTSLAIDAAVETASADAPIDAAVVADAVIDEPPIDARRTAIDAGTRRRPIDAGRMPAPRDATVAATPIDAAAPAPKGRGTVTIRTKGTHSLVTLDGASLGSTPIVKRSIPAGTHRLEMRPITGGDLWSTTFEIADGETKIITQP